MNKYSVLMSVYNKENPEYLRMAIQSMLDQTYKADEIVIVKDGTLTPELDNVLSEFSERYPKIFNIVGYEKNRGLGLALNYGLEHCRNELVARMDTDDISLSERCEEQVKFMCGHKEVDLVGGDIAEFIGLVENIVAYRKVPKTSDKINSYIKTRCPFNHMSVMYRKSKVFEAGSYKDWFWNEDYYLWLRMYLNGCTFANTGTTLVNVRVGEDMYKRRGGYKYFKSEFDLQTFMLKNNIIGYSTYFMNCLKRLIVQVLLPNSVRGWVFRKFARE